MSEAEDYSELLKKYKNLQLELERTNQTLYECGRQVKTAQTIEAEYQEEIKFLQSQGTLEQQNLKAKIQQLEETNTNLRASYNEQISDLEKELSNKEGEIEELKKQLEDIIKITTHHEPIGNDTLVEELDELRKNNLDLCEKVEDLQKLCDSCERQNSAFQETIKQMTEELENYKETLSFKKEELVEANTLIQNLKDDYLCVKSELDMVKSSKPLDDQSKGNSLFAEVNDRRLQLQQNITIMKKQYMEMKRERANNLKQIATLRNENATLIAQRELEVEGRKNDDEMIIETYKKEVQTLNELIKSYQNELKEKYNVDNMSVTPQGIKFFDNMIAMKNQEIEELRQKIEKKSFNHRLLSYDLAQANRQIRKYNLEILRLKNEIGMLKVQTQEMEMVTPLEQPLPEMKLPKSIVKAKTEEIEIIDLDETNKENDTDNASSKKVQFTADTADTEVAGGSKRRGAKVLQTKIRYYN